jgi:hypothetical protein
MGSQPGQSLLNARLINTCHHKQYECLVRPLLTMVNADSRRRRLKEHIFRLDSEATCVSLLGRHGTPIGLMAGPVVL